MHRIQKIKAALGMAAACAAVVALPGQAGAASAVAQPTAAQSAAAAASCASGHVCFWSGANYTGSKCTWLDADPDWYAGSLQCSWAKNGTLARSVWNAGTSSKSGVAYYSGASYSNRVGCTPQGKGGNFTQGRALRSHQWITGACG
ncbi:peptidase inhibitor family I36 protein [Streptomyces sp. NPDC007107]|uniref:peptidase inhibitor family I36 protein n=1 Tax=Streptomyces sp. NPDC007107 TaxID=3156915 RepID=UPI0033E59054